jgi:hypothetical protein
MKLKILTYFCKTKLKTYLMKKTLLSTITILGFGAYSALGQMYVPAASALPAGSVGQMYAGQTISFTVPATTTIDGSTVGSAIAAQFPAAAAFTGALSGQTFPLSITSTTLSVDGLPAGITATCSATPCTFVAGASGSFILAGTPTSGGSFTVDITSLTSGSADITAFVAGLPLPIPGVPNEIAIPQPVPAVLDEAGYTIVVSGTNGIEESNAIFSLSVFPNPTVNASTLAINSTINGVANVEIYSIAGVLVNSRSEAIRIGANRLSLDMETLPSGNYMVKTIVNGNQALIRVQKN